MSKAPRNSAVWRTAIALLDYWRVHPQAKDSARGIAQYWLGESEDTVRQALTLLVEEGVIDKRRHLYRLAALRAVPEDSGAKHFDKTLRRLRRSVRTAEP